MAALIVALPQRIAVSGGDRLPRQPQRQQRDRQHAAAEREQRQQQQRRQQPEAFIQRRRAALALGFGSIDLVGFKHAQRHQVAVVRRECGVGAAAGRGERAQRRAVQARGQHLAVAGAIRTAGRGAQPQHRDPIPRVAGLDRRRIGAAARAISDQQDVSATETSTRQQPRRFLDGAVGAAAVARHHVRRQRIQEQRDVVGVAGQRRDRVGIVGEGHQRNLSATAGAQNVRDLGARLQQPRRLHIRGLHGERHVHRDHQRVAVLPQRLRHGAPARARQRQHRQREGDRQRRRRQHCPPSAGRARPALQQMRQQVRVDGVAPDVAAQAAAAQPPQQRRYREQAEQPQRPQELEIVDDRGHRVASRRFRNTSSANSSDADSGHA